MFMRSPQRQPTGRRRAICIRSAERVCKRGKRERKRTAARGVCRGTRFYRERYAREMPCAVARTRTPGMPVDEIPPGTTISSGGKRKMTEGPRGATRAAYDHLPPGTSARYEHTLGQTNSVTAVSRET